MTLRVLVAPTPAQIQALVSVAEAKQQVRIDYPDHDAMLQRLIGVALGEVEKQVQRRYLTQTLAWVLQGWPDELKLPVAPVASVTSITYRDTAGALQTLAPTSYRVRPAGQATVITPADGVCFPALGDHAEPLVIEFIAGTAPAGVSPEAKHALLLTVQALYDQRDIDVGSLLAGERWD